jgi:MFS family permease
LLTRNIWILSLVSLCTDVASEMLYPIMPIYLRQIGFSIVLIGVLEGFAEAVAGLSKGYFGQWSDRTARRLPFVQLGYGLSAVSKPMMAALTAPWWIFVARTVDRLGKGLRTGARDALLSDETTAEHKGRVFGFHRSMDSFGAVLGPFAALLFLAYRPGEYALLFYLAFVPGLLAVLMTLLIRERRDRARQPGKTRPGLFEFMRYWPRSTPAYRRVAGALLVFALFNSSDAFLLLRLKESGLDDVRVIAAYILFNLVFALTAYPLGRLADRLGMRRVLVAGLAVFTAVYAGMALNQTPAVFFGLLVLYGLYSAATEGVAKAWLTNLCRREDTATAIGAFTAFQSVAALGASSLAGFLWFSVGPAAAFIVPAAVAVGVAVFLFFSAEQRDQKTERDAG